MFARQQVSEEYFSSMSSPARRLVQDIIEIRSDIEWDDPLKRAEGEKLLDDRLIHNHLDLTPKPQKYHTLSSCRGRNKNIKNGNDSNHTASTLRLSTFGVEQVFPRLKVTSGQNETTVEETSGSQCEDLSDNCRTYTYRDEHSSPFSWMSRSQQELRFQSGTPPEDSPTPEELVENGLEIVRTISPSRVGGKQRHSHLVRQSRGNPSFAKAVGIPKVPNLLTKSAPGVSEGLERKMNPPVSPHRINNFVCETSPNRLVLDFGVDEDAVLGGSRGREDKRSLNGSSDHSCSDGSTGGGGGGRASHYGLFSKMKNKTRASLKRSLSSVSRNRRKSSQQQNQTDGDLANSNTTLSTSSITRTSTTSSLLSSATPLNNKTVTTPKTSSALKNSSPQQSSPQSTVSSSRHIVKPNSAPPPPPPVTYPSLNKLSRTLPDQQVADTPSLESVSSAKEDDSNKIIYRSLTNGESVPAASSMNADSKGTINITSVPSSHGIITSPAGGDVTTSSKSSSVQESDDAPLEGFKVDLSIGSEIPKTGFDFLDNW